MIEIKLPSSHCSGCGHEVDYYDTDEGYTSCCNEPLCDSDGQDRYAIGDNTGDRPDGREVRACCPAAATVKAEALGKVYLERIIW